MQMMERKKTTHIREKNDESVEKKKKNNEPKKMMLRNIIKKYSRSHDYFCTRSNERLVLSWTRVHLYYNYYDVVVTVGS
jgi:hypothetical protein